MGLMGGDVGSFPMGGMGGGFGNGIPGMGMGGGGMLGFMSGGNTPQDRGFGISDPSEFVGYDTSPGLMPADTSGYGSLDMSGPGAAEQQFAQNQDKYNAPGRAQNWFSQYGGQFGNPGSGEQFASSALSHYGAPGGTPQVSNNAQTAFNAAEGHMPNLSADPGLAPYYENAKRRAGEDINKAAAARGGYNSSVALDQLNESATNLEADRAKNEAQYALQRSADTRNWDQTLGGLAQGADSSSLAGSNNQLGWMRGLGDLAMNGQQAMENRLNSGFGMANGADTGELNRLGAGMNAAGMAQNAQEGRAQQLFQNQMGFGNALSSLAGQNYDPMMQQDQALMDGGMGMELGLGAEALNQDYRGQQRIKDDASWAEDMMSGGGGGKGGGGMGGLLGMFGM